METATHTGPDWSFEKAQSAKIGKPNAIICGVDEAGRGPLAGPVVAAAVYFPDFNAPEGLNDSKKLSEVKREKLFAEIMETGCVGVAIAEPEEIDRINILQASLQAMCRAIKDLPQRPDLALIDGNKIPDINIGCLPIIKGDQKSISIAAASIIAKVTRDRLMILADQRFPGYGLAGHKGYPTKAHRAAIIKGGPCSIHRFSFKTIREIKTKPAI